MPKITMLPPVGRLDPKLVLKYIKLYMPKLEEALLRSPDKLSTLNKDEISTLQNDRKPRAEYLGPRTPIEAGISDGFRALAESLMPKPKPRAPQVTYKRSPGGGRKPHPNRDILNTIVFVLRSGIAWKKIPSRLGCSGTAAHRYFREWSEEGFFDRLWKEGLAEHPDLEGIHWSCSHRESQDERGQKVFKPFWLPSLASQATTQKPVQK